MNGISVKDDAYELFFRVSTFFTPGTVYRVDLKDPSFKLEMWREMKLKNVNQDDFTSKQVFYASKDGTKVPMFVNYKNGLKLDSSENVILLYGYGGFNIALGPSFSPFNLMFMQHFDGIFCQANIRGGSEYGEEWHTGGQILNKQNVFDDFIGAADYMVHENYTNPSRIIIQGERRNLGIFLVCFVDSILSSLRSLCIYTCEASVLVRTFFFSNLSRKFLFQSWALLQLFHSMCFNIRIIISKQVDAFVTHQMNRKKNDLFQPT